MNERLLPATQESDIEWTIEEFGIGEGMPPGAPLYKEVYRSGGNVLQRRVGMTVEFDSSGAIDGEMLAEFLETYSDSQLVKVPGIWVNTDLSGYWTEPTFKLVGWDDVLRDEQIGLYRAHKAEHERRHSV